MSFESVLLVLSA